MKSEDYLSLITSQHRQLKFQGTVKASITPLVDQMNFMRDLNKNFDVDSAVGSALQIIADWIGAPNSIPNSVPIPFFGFQGQPESLPFGEQTSDFDGGYFRESGVSGNQAKAMTPKQFKKIVKAQIKLNHSDCSLDSAKEIIEMITDKKFRIKDNQNMTVTFEFLEDHNLIDRELVKLMFPTPAGVRLIFGNEDEY